MVTSSIVRLISRANLLLERAKADVRKTPRPALRVGRAAVAQAISGSGAALARAGGTPSFWWPSLRRQSELDQAPDCLGPGRQVRPPPPVGDDPQFCAQIATLGLVAMVGGDHPEG